jgi:ABC-2 type transport system permease protein
MKKRLQSTQTPVFVLHPKLLINEYDQNVRHRSLEVTALTRRLLIQGWRRPSILLTGILQPLLWLLLFGALFQNAPIELFSSTDSYSSFLGAGIIVFTSFTGSLNAGLPLIFDREFGFLNRLLSSPIESRYSIVTSSSFNITLVSMLQVIAVIQACSLTGNPVPSLQNLIIIISILLLLSNSITGISIMLAFILPGHIELLACLIVINLPLLFSSTALAPLVFMPSWLQIIACLNPLSYAIESIRYAYLNYQSHDNSIVMNTVWGSVSLFKIFVILGVFNLISFTLVKQLISKRLEE